MSAARLAHASGDDLARFVLDALDAPARTRLEHHLRGCPRCAAALAREAAAEMELEALWPRVRRPIAEVVTLRPRAAPAAAAAAAVVAAEAAAPPVRAAARPANGSYGALAAAVMALFIGWWADAGSAGPRVATGPSSAGETSGVLALSSVESAEDQRVCVLPASGLPGICGGGVPASIQAPVATGGLCRMPGEALMCASRQ